MSHPYGYCPKCGAPGVSRERRVHGNDLCERGHEYPSTTSRAASSREQLGHVIRAVLDEMATEAFCDLKPHKRQRAARWAIVFLARTIVVPAPSYPEIVRAINEKCPEYLHLRSHVSILHAMYRIGSGADDELCVLVMDLVDRAKRRMPTW